MKSRLPHAIIENSQHIKVPPRSLTAISQWSSVIMDGFQYDVEGGSYTLYTLVHFQYDLADSHAEHFWNYHGLRQKQLRPRPNIRTLTVLYCPFWHSVALHLHPSHEPTSPIQNSQSLDYRPAHSSKSHGTLTKSS